MEEQKSIDWKNLTLEQWLHHEKLSNWVRLLAKFGIKSLKDVLLLTDGDIVDIFEELRKDNSDIFQSISVADRIIVKQKLSQLRSDYSTYISNTANNNVYLTLGKLVQNVRKCHEEAKTMVQNGTFVTLVNTIETKHTQSQNNLSLLLDKIKNTLDKHNHWNDIHSLKNDFILLEDRMNNLLLKIENNEKNQNNSVQDKIVQCQSVIHEFRSLNNKLNNVSKQANYFVDQCDELLRNCNNLTNSLDICQPLIVNSISENRPQENNSMNQSIHANDLNVNNIIAMTQGKQNDTDNYSPRDALKTNTMTTRNTCTNETKANDYTDKDSGEIEFVIATTHPSSQNSDEIDDDEIASTSVNTSDEQNVASHNMLSKLKSNNNIVDEKQEDDGLGQFKIIVDDTAMTEYPQNDNNNVR